ncbi:MAG: Maf family protein, partial [Pseudomonadota bacterium]
AVLMRDANPIWRHIGSATLTMRPFSDTFLDGYLDRMGESVTDTVGGYQLEGLGGQLFSRVEGDYFSILGLPLLELLDILRRQDVLQE